MFKRNPSFFLLALLGLCCCPSAQAVQSGPNYLVNTTSDSGDNVCDDAGTGDGCTLREAIAAANGDGVNSIIGFDATVFASKQTITLGGTQLSVSANGTLSILGPTAGVIISGNRVSRVFSISSSNDVNLVGLTISQGNSGSCGGIFNSGNLNVTNCTIFGNSASDSGGGIFSNTNLSTVTLVITNSTISGNSAAFEGGGIFNFDGLTRIQSSTITGNSAPAGQGGGIATFGDDVTRTRLSNSIVAANTSSDVDITNGSVNSFVSEGYNLIGNGNAIAAFAATGDRTGVNDPLLGPLADNGGPTVTHLPQKGSPAIDKSNTALATDQRGLMRPFDDPSVAPATGGNNSDIGAVEVQSGGIGLGVSITPKAPRTVDTLTATPVVVDGTDVIYTYIWSVNGVQKQSGPDNTFRLSVPGQGNKGDLISVVVNATRGAEKGTATNSVAVFNSAPFAFSGTTIAQSSKEVLIPFSAADRPRAGDADGDALTYKLVGGARNGSATFETDAAGRTSLRYTSRFAFFGVDSLRFVAIDEENQTSNVATLGIDVQGSLSVPTAESRLVQAKAGETVDIPLVGSNPAGGPVTFKRVGGPVNGTGSIITDAQGAAIFRYTSRSNFGGTEDVRYVAINDEGRPSSPATLRIVVSFDAPPAPIPNNAPTTSDVTATTTSGVEVAIPLAGDDPDGDPITFKRVGGPVNGGGEIRQDSDGIFKMFYLPRARFVGTETIRFVALDDKGKPSEVATMTITVSAPGAPSAASAMSVAPSAGSS